MKAFSLNSVSSERNKNIYGGILFGASVFAVTVLTVNFIAPNMGVSAASQTAEQTVGPHTMSMSNDSVATIDITPTNTQTIYNTTNNLTVSNTCSAGATITMRTSGTDNALTRPAVNGDTLTKAISATTSTSLDNTSWGFSLDSGTTWGAVPASNGTAATVYDGTAVASNVTVPVMFGVKVDNTLPSGAYTNDIVYTMTPKGGCLSYSVTWDFNGGNAKADTTYPSTLNWGQTIDLSALTPTRDGYTFTGWSVGSSTYTNEDTSADLNPDSAVAITVTANWVVDVYNFGYTGSTQTWTAPTTGYYKLEAWGASGSNHSTATLSYPGSGGYVAGVIKLNEDSILYIQVGQDNYDRAVGAIETAYNGGGSNGNGSGRSDGYTEASDRSGAGGGATDFRLISGTWNNVASLRSRIMVAGGGGGVATAFSAISTTGHAGGLSGYSGVNTHDSRYPAHTPATGGTQVGGGSTTSFPSGANDVYPANGYGSVGVFGIGGNSNRYTGSGGGGGWYGGGGGGVSAGSISSGAGGSSYISGHTGSVGVTSTSSSSPKSGCTTGTTNNDCSLTPYVNPATNASYKFTNTVMIDGSGYAWTNTKGSLQAMPNPNGGNYASGVGHSGNGYARITYLGN